MANTFEQTVAILAENRIAAEHPNLSEYRMGFVLLDFDEQAQKAFGVYRFMIGTVPALMPVVYRKGELDGLDILILRDLPLFVPAIDSWISTISSSGVQDLGELMEDKGPGKGPSAVIMQLKEFPYMLKTAEAKLSSKEAKALKSALQSPIDTELLHHAIVDDVVATWLEEFPKGAALIAKTAESDEEAAEILGERFGDDTMRTFRSAISKVCPGDMWLTRKAEPACRDPFDKVKVITDIGSPEAKALRASEKRILLREGQFVVDHRAESETTLVFRSPDSNMFQTCPGPGNWQMLTQDGDLVEIETCIPFDDEDDSGYPIPAKEGIGENRKIWVLPLDGKRPFKCRARDLYVRDSREPLEIRPKPGKPASRAAVLASLEVPRWDSPEPVPGVIHKRGRILVCGGGRAFSEFVDRRVDAGDNEPIVVGYPQRSMVFTDSPGRIRRLEDRWMIPSTARVVSFEDMHDDRPSIPLGRPSDLKNVMEKKDDVKEMAIVMRDDLVSISGAIKKNACSENQAKLGLVFDAGIPASTAATILRDVKSRPGVEHRYLLKRALFMDQTEDNALSGLSFTVPEQTQQYIDPGILNEQGRDMAGKVKGEGVGGDIDEKIIKKVLSMSDFREITSDSVRRFTSAMDEAGKMLLRILVHRGRYEDRYGEDVENMETSIREGFVKNGDLALFLREKRGSGGAGDAESALAGLLTEDMG